MNRSLSIIAGVFLSAGTAFGTTIHVDAGNCPGPGSGTQADPFCRIQAGIDAAVSGDDVLAADGTYNELINFNGKAITLHSVNGAAMTTIDGTGLNDSVVKCVTAEGPDTVLSGFRITNGNAADGGGMLNFMSSPTVTDCVFSGNTAQNGGGMYNNSSIATMTRCVFSGNVANNIGGGMVNSTFSDVTVTDCAFSGNTAAAGGGMRNGNFSSPTVTNCTFIGNTATISGGGGMANIIISDPTVIDCTFKGNDALRGGGMCNAASSPTLTNCTFIANTAFRSGGIDNAGANPTLTNCTFSGNIADNDAGGMFNFSTSTPTVANSIWWGNIPNQIVDGPAAVTTVTYSDVQNGWPGVGNIGLDPLFADADLRLSGGSPAIDDADNAAVPLGVLTDLDGNPRFVDDPDTPDTGNGTPPIVDMGAYEFQRPPPIPTVSQWGLVVMVTLLLIAATTIFARRKNRQPTDHRPETGVDRGA
ncbi:MAG: IPTL-CTERM sorting domain-containing protein [Phycisphaerae bacterium]